MGVSGPLTESLRTRFYHVWAPFNVKFELGLDCFLDPHVSCLRPHEPATSIMWPHPNVQRQPKETASPGGQGTSVPVS